MGADGGTGRCRGGRRPRRGPSAASRAVATRASAPVRPNRLDRAGAGQWRCTRGITDEQQHGGRARRAGAPLRPAAVPWSRRERCSSPARPESSRRPAQRAPARTAAAISSPRRLALRPVPLSLPGRHGRHSGRRRQAAAAPGGRIAVHHPAGRIEQSTASGSRSMRHREPGGSLAAFSSWTRICAHRRHGATGGSSTHLGRSRPWPRRGTAREHADRDRHARMCHRSLGRAHEPRSAAPNVRYRARGSGTRQPRPAFRIDAAS